MTVRGWCSDCPDREACATGWTCAKVRAVATTADADTQAAIRRTAQQINAEIERTGRTDAGLLGDLLFLILGPTDRGTVRCVGCSPDSATGEDIDINPDCPRHGADAAYCDTCKRWVAETREFELSGAWLCAACRIKAEASTVPDHLPDNDESRGHGSVR